MKEEIKDWEKELKVSLANLFISYGVVNQKVTAEKIQDSLLRIIKRLLQQQKQKDIEKIEKSK